MRLTWSNASNIRQHCQQEQCRADKIAAFGDPRDVFNPQWMDAEEKRRESSCQMNRQGAGSIVLEKRNRQNPQRQQIYQLRVKGMKQDVGEVKGARVHARAIGGMRAEDPFAPEAIPSERHPGDRRVVAVKEFAKHPLEIAPAQSAKTRVANEVGGIIPIQKLATQAWD